MQLSILLPLLVCFVGLLIYGFASNPKVAELGRLAYACGLLVTLFALIGRVLHL